MSGASAATSVTRNLSEQAYDRIRRDIIQGELFPGDKLTIEAMSDRYGIGARTGARGAEAVCRPGSGGNGEPSRLQRYAHFDRGAWRSWSRRGSGWKPRAGPELRCR